MMAAEEGRGFPYQVKSGDGARKQVVAARNIMAGETVLMENPKIITLMARDYPRCLACLACVDYGFLCERCGYPLCDDVCAGTQKHKVECELIRTIGGRVE